MRTYDIFSGQRRLATVIVQEAGHIRWEYAPDVGPGQPLNADTQRVMEEAITLVPTAQVLTGMEYTMRQRPPARPTEGGGPP